MDLSELITPHPDPYGYAATAGQAPAANTPTGGLDGISTPTARGLAAVKLHSPDNPLFWFGAVVALSFGLAAFSTSVRVGKTTASVKLGD